MTPAFPNLRYEMKFVAVGFTLAEVLARVRRHPSAFREVYPPRTVNNLYLDSPSRGDYRDHISGVANRSKTRVRWYGQPPGLVEQPRLELKQKRGMVSGKEAYALPPLAINGSPVRPLLEAALDAAALPPWLRPALHRLNPALFNRYRRQYFLSHDGKFRLTVDHALEFAGIPQHGWPTLFSLSAASVIIELKYATELAEHAGRVTNALPFRVARFSKYVAGIEQI
jgi:hypothetical protein